MRLHISEPAFLGNEDKYVADAMYRKALSGGEYVARFEEAFAAAVGVRHVVAVSSGTAALHAALLALGCRENDAVFVPACTYIATANAVRYCGATPFICDVDPATWCLDPQSVAQAVHQSLRRGYRPAGVVPVHLYGVPADVFALASLCERHSMWMLEDAAEAHGAEVTETVEGKDGMVTVRVRSVGSIGSAGVFSFYGNKILTTGEGGMVTTNDGDTAGRCRSLRGQGASAERYVHTSLGFNYRMTDLQAAVGLAQVEQLGSHLARRTALGDRYREALVPLASGVRPGSVDWVMPVLVGGRDRIARLLAEVGIETRPVFPPLHRQPALAGAPTVGSLPVSERLAADGLLLPLHANMTVQDVDAVVYALRHAMAEPAKERAS